MYSAQPALNQTRGVRVCTHNPRPVCSQPCTYFLFGLFSGHTDSNLIAGAIFSPFMHSLVCSVRSICRLIQTSSRAALIEHAVVRNENWQMSARFQPLSFPRVPFLLLGVNVFCSTWQERLNPLRHRGKGPGKLSRLRRAGLSDIPGFSWRKPAGHVARTVSPAEIVSTAIYHLLTGANGARFGCPSFPLASTGAGAPPPSLIPVICAIMAFASTNGQGVLVLNKLCAPSAFTGKDFLCLCHSWLVGEERGKCSVGSHNQPSVQ